MKIGVFDSGVGGKYIAQKIGERFPNHEITLREDKEHLPYGDKTPKELLDLTSPILQQLVSSGCEVIVVACNTVTTTIIGQLRQKISVPIVAIEPMIKPAASLTKTNTIAVCATPATLRSDRYKALKTEFASGIRVIEPDCSNWAFMIEQNQITQEAINQVVDSVITERADVIVLACTHYHWIEELITEVAVGKAKVIQPTDAILSRLETVISEITNLAPR